MKKTLVLGASPNPARFANKTVKSLIRHNIPVVPLGNREGEIMGHEILTGKPDLPDIHTVTLYLNPQNQKEYYNYLISLSPRRIIFNPGSENQELIKLAIQNEIEVNVACTLIMINSGKY